MSAPNRDPQALVDRFFDASAADWQTVYSRQDLQGLIYRSRMETAARWAAELGPEPPAAALDAGCGAGLMSLELARSRLWVTATDSSQEMVQRARWTMAENGLGDLVRTVRADVLELPFSDGEFQLVVALGLIPWPPDPGRAIGELGRVLSPGGTIVLTADNRCRLNRIVEPRESPVLAPVRRIRAMLRRRASKTPGGPPAWLHDPGEIDAMLQVAGFRIVRRATVGFGPFTFRGCTLLPDGLGTRLHRRLHRASEDHPRLRGGGWHYLVAGVKDGTPRSSTPSEAARC